MSKHALIDMIITEKSKNVIYTRENDDLTKEGANELLKNNISNISHEVKARPKPLNN